MKQPQVNIEGFGIKPVISLIWDLNGNLSSIQVDFMGKQIDPMVMYDVDNTGNFRNVYNNLKGKLIFE